jgi:hypothetical protein
VTLGYVESVDGGAPSDLTAGCALRGGGSEGEDEDEEDEGEGDSES